MVLIIILLKLTTTIGLMQNYLSNLSNVSCIVNKKEIET